MSIRRGIEETDAYFEPITNAAKRRILGIEDTEYFEIVSDDDYSLSDFDDSTDEY